jgi:hypothetical protein
MVEYSTYHDLAVFYMNLHRFRSDVRNRISISEVLNEE